MVKKNKGKVPKFPSELRYDVASKNWVVIATGRAKRPEHFVSEKRASQKILKKDCPFCNIKNQEFPTLIFSNGKEVQLKKDGKDLYNWTTVVLPNKYPAFLPSSRLEKKTEGGIYQKMNAAGYHEIVVTKDHNKQLAQFSAEKIKEVIDVYQRRYLELMKEKFVNYISIFHNHGAEAGASISHPHSQILTTPLIDVDLSTALVNAKKYYKKNKKCIYCTMGEWEKKVKKRIVFENSEFLVICPFASKSAFQVIITPKKHQPYFERISENQKWQLAEAFKEALGRVYKGLKDPAYNFYLHTAPCDGTKNESYHWHWTILPKTSIWAGFEIGTRMEISTIEPEVAASHLRKQK
jgi:UDPglucose--hexose-1-phosphate uridylyltransferase